MIAVNHRIAPDPVYSPRASPTDITKSQHGSLFAPLVSTAPNSPVREKTKSCERPSQLFPADDFPEIVPDVRLLSSENLASAHEYNIRYRLPDSNDVFPWLHGIHRSNSDQRLFFDITRPSMMPRPKGLRTMTLIPAHSALKGQAGRLVNSLDLWDVFTESDNELSFVDGDPPNRIGLRNFHIQAIKLALVSDIVIYDIENAAENDQILLLASSIAAAQKKYAMRQHWKTPKYGTFVLAETFKDLQRKFPFLVVQDLQGASTSYEHDFLELEKKQMQVMSQATEIAPNVFLGNSEDWLQDSTYKAEGQVSPAAQFCIHIRCEDYVPIPSLSNGEIIDDGDPDHVLEVGFPSSGCLGQPSENEVKDLIDFCSWIYEQTHAFDNVSNEMDTPDFDRGHTSEDFTNAGSISDEILDHLNIDARHGASKIRRAPRKVLITCKDGYTETTLLAIAYTIFVNCMTVDEAWVHLHKEKKRNFYAFSEDVAAMKIIARQLIQASPHSIERKVEVLSKEIANWFNDRTNAVQFSGSFPSRIMDHLYLGNLEHANRTEMLKAIGIERVLSIGETPTWTGQDLRSARMSHKFLDSIMDDGIDSLTSVLDSCLQFIDEGFQSGQVTLVHCRVGVSRSASICIAEMVRRRCMSLPEAYLFVRARRLNVIIQPNLRFMYELHKWAQEEISRQKGLSSGRLVPRVIEWGPLSSKIAALNRFYTQR